MAYLSRLERQSKYLILFILCSFWMESTVASTTTVSDKAQEFPGNYEPALVSLSINQQSLSNSVMVLRNPQGLWLLPVESLIALNVRVPETAQTRFNGHAYIGLDALAPKQINMDELSQTLNIELDPEYFNSNHLHSRTGNNMTHADSAAGAFLNYDVLFDHSPIGLSQSFFTEGGLALGPGVAVADYIFLRQPGLDKNLRLNTSYTVDFPQDMMSLHLGDSVSRPPTSLGRPVRFAGLQWGTNFMTQPGLITVPVATVSGQAALPSTLDLYVNNVLQSHSPVAPGPFSVTSAPLLAGDGEVLLKVRDLSGREEVISQRFYSSTSLLAAGLSEYSTEIGALRKNFGIESNDYGDIFMSSGYRKGVNNSLTLDGGFSVQQGGLLGLLGSASSAFARLGTGSLALGMSHENGQYGLQGAAGFERRTNTHSFSIRSQIADDKYRQTGIDADQTLRRLDSFFYGYRIEQIGNLGFSYTRQQRAGAEAIEIANASFGTRQTAWGSFFLSWIQTRGASRDNSINLLWVMSLGRDINLSAFHTRASHATDQSVIQLQKNLPTSEGIGYRLQAADHAAQQATLLAQNQYGMARLEAAEYQGISSTRIGFSGALAYLDNEWFATRRIDNSYGVVRLPGMSQVRVYVDNQLAAKTNDRGYAFLPRLYSYAKNNVSVEQLDLPLDVEIDALRMHPVPAWRSGVIIDVPVRSVAAATLNLFMPDGHPVPAGSLVSLDGNSDKNADIFTVGYQGLLYLAGLKSTNHLYVTWPQGHCVVSLPYAPEKGHVPYLGEYLCHTEAESQP